MKEMGLKYTGTYHQRGKHGAPYFDNGKKLCYSLRCWGGLMAEVMNIEGDMAYAQWAWWNPEEEVFPYDDGSFDETNIEEAMSGVRTISIPGYKDIEILTPATLLKRRESK